VAAFESTRVQLAAWTPPVQTLGFRITRAEADASRPSGGSEVATVLRSAAWWKQPLPAWAQMAAAVVIFASGMTIGVARSAPQVAAVVATNGASSTPVAQTTAAHVGVTPEELAQVEQRLRSELTQVRTASSQHATGGDDRAVMQRVSQMIAASEEQQMKELDFRTSQIVRDFANTRQIDLANIEQRLGVTRVKVLSNQQDINSLAQRVGYTPTYSPYVP
jgi:hypothetical protein